MRVLVISDIHANLAAFEAVLQDAKGKWDQIWCLGDVIGYGPDPNECVALLREQNHISLSGNHDWAVLGKMDITIFNPEARKAIEWTRSVVSSESYNYLDSLPTMIEEAPFTLAHASPRQPVWEYILDIGTAAANFEHFNTPYCLVGHTHVPILFAEELGSNKILPYGAANNTPIQLNKRRCIINPGSVGQPRDSDPRAAYVLLDTEKLIWEFNRVEYPFRQTQESMRLAGIPVRLARRLEFGW